MRDGITYLFPNFNGRTVDVWWWISNFITEMGVVVVVVVVGVWGCRGGGEGGGGGGVGGGWVVGLLAFTIHHASIDLSVFHGMCSEHNHKDVTWLSWRLTAQATRLLVH